MASSVSSGLSATPSEPFNLLNFQGHEYHVQQSLGKYAHITPQQVMTAIKTSRLFPLTIIRGSFSTVGNRVVLGIPFLHRLTCLPFSQNSVEVVELKETSIQLKACEDHLFSGSTVLMKIEKVKGELVFFVDGYGSSRETSFRYYTNLLFAKVGLWHLFIKYNVTPHINELERQLYTNSFAIMADNLLECPNV